MATTQERAVHDATPTCSMYAGAEAIVLRAAARSHKEYTRADDLCLARAPMQEREVELGCTHCTKPCADSACLNITIMTLSHPHQSSLTLLPQLHIFSCCCIQRSASMSLRRLQRRRPLPAHLPYARHEYNNNFSRRHGARGVSEHGPRPSHKNSRRL